MMASAMVGSAFTAPHVTEWITVDVTRTMEFVDRLKSRREFRDVKVSPLLVLSRAVILAMRRTPEINSFWDEAAQEVVYKSYVNLGIAAATPRGLVVPNVKEAQDHSLLDLAAALNQLTATARDGKTQPAEMAGGTFTITNVGVFGVDAGTPIINPGESAILCFGAVRKQPWVVRRRRSCRARSRRSRCPSTTVTSTARRARGSWPTSPASWRTRRPRCCSDRVRERRRRHLPGRPRLGAGPSHGGSAVGRDSAPIRIHRPGSVRPGRRSQDRWEGSGWRPTPSRVTRSAALR